MPLSHCLFVLKTAKTFEEDLIQFFACRGFFQIQDYLGEKKHSYIIQKGVNEVLPPIPLGTRSHVRVQCEQHFPAILGLPCASEQIISLLDLYIKRSFTVQEGWHNVCISLHIVWRDRDKLLETKEIFTGWALGSIVRACMSSSAASSGTRHPVPEEDGDKQDREVLVRSWLARFGSCFLCFAAQQKPKPTPPGQPSAAGQHAVNPKPHCTDLAMERTLWPHEQITHTEAHR